MRFRHLLLLLFTLSSMTGVSLAQEQIVHGTLNWSPNGQWLAVAQTNGNVLISRLDDPKHIIELKHSSLVTSIAWSPDSSRIATITPNDGLIYIRDAATGSLLKTLVADISLEGGFIDWNPKQELLVSIGYAGDGGMFAGFWDTKTYEQIGFTTWIAPTLVKWNPDGTLLAFKDAYRGLEIYDAFTGDFIEPKIGISGIWSMDWSPDGSKIGAVKYDSTAITENDTIRYETDSWLVILDTSTLQEIDRLTRSAHNALGLVLWSPDGTRIALSRPDYIEIIDLKSGISLERFPISEKHYFSFAWSPFGGHLAIVGLTDENLGDHLPNIPDVQIVVPDPSSTVLLSIQNSCVPPAVRLPDPASLMSYIEAVRANTTIPFGCAADLIAVAEALQAQ